MMDIFVSIIISSLISGFAVFFYKILLERHKNSLEREITKLSHKLGFVEHVSRQQFDKEFNIYQEIWGKVLPAQVAVQSLRPASSLDSYDPKESKEERINRRLKEFYDNARPLFELVEKNKPFIDIEVYKKVNELLKISRFEAIEYQHLDPADSYKDYWESARKNQDKIEKLIDEACELIRNRLQSIQVRE